MNGILKEMETRVEQLEELMWLAGATFGNQNETLGNQNESIDMLLEGNKLVLKALKGQQEMIMKLDELTNSIMHRIITITLFVYPVEQTQQLREMLKDAKIQHEDSWPSINKNRSKSEGN